MFFLSRIFSRDLLVARRDALLERRLLPEQRRWKVHNAQWRCHHTTSSRPQLSRIVHLKVNVSFFINFTSYLSIDINFIVWYVASYRCSAPSGPVCRAAGNDRRAPSQRPPFWCWSPVCWLPEQWDCGTPWSSSRRKRWSARSSSSNGTLWVNLIFRLTHEVFLTNVFFWLIRSFVTTHASRTTGRTSWPGPASLPVWLLPFCCPELLSVYEANTRKRSSSTCSTWCQVNSIFLSNKFQC